MEMSLWVKIALVIMAVASVLGVAAFVLVIKHVASSYSGPRIITIERAMDNEADNDDCNSVCGFVPRIMALEDRMNYAFNEIDNVDGRVDIVTDKIENVNDMLSYHVDEVNKRIDRLKKRVKALEEKEG